MLLDLSHSHDRTETALSRKCLHHVCVTARGSVSRLHEVTRGPYMAKSDAARRAVSVIVPAFGAGAGAGVAGALASVFAQTFADFDVIVVDDGSPDTAGLEAAVAPFLSRIQFVV